MRRVLGLAVVAALATACASTTAGDSALVGTRPPGAPATGSTGPTTTASRTAPPPITADPTTAVPTGRASTTAAAGVVPIVTWQSCGTGLECATLTVPKDYDDPTKGTLDLFLKRHPAAKRALRIGSLLVNPGGPGAPTTSYMIDNVDGYFGSRLTDRFDIVGWDPRGTGKSGQIVCVDSLDPYFALDLSPDDATEKRQVVDAAASFDAQCAARNPGLLPYVSTEATARDMDSIRRALGEPKISYFGFSYGSALGAVWATLFPDTVRAMVIDSAIDPNAGAAAQTRQTAVGTERALTNMLTACAKNRSCALYNGGDPGALFDKVMADLDRTPLRVADAPGSPLVNQGVAFWAIADGLDNEQFWPALTSALAQAAKGNGRGLLDLYTDYLTVNGDYPHLFESLLAINCLDDPEPVDQAAFDRLDAEIRQLAPRLGALELNPPFCRSWPVRGKPPVKVTGKGAGPVVVVGSTGDPVTPIESSSAMARALEGGVLVTAQANQHIGYQTSTCVNDAVENYLVGLKVPPAGLICAATS